ncbi:MAG: DUF1801 domain-containing protein [Flavobacterium sp.]|nr:MAG: DUF1801 domain-containing protein [Flavobacterium sp.]
MDQPTINALHHYYDKQEPNIKECLFALKSIILSLDDGIVHMRKYKIPFFRYKNYNLGFLWVYRKNILIGFITDKRLLPNSLNSKNRDDFYTVKINPLEDIPIGLVRDNFKEIIDKCITGPK